MGQALALALALAVDMSHGDVWFGLVGPLVPALTDGD